MNVLQVRKNVRDIKTKQRLHLFVAKNKKGGCARMGCVYLECVVINEVLLSHYVYG